MLFRVCFRRTMSMKLLKRAPPTLTTLTSRSDHQPICSLGATLLTPVRVAWQAVALADYEKSSDVELTILKGDRLFITAQVRFAAVRGRTRELSHEHAHACQFGTGERVVLRQQRAHWRWYAQCLCCVAVT